MKNPMSLAVSLGTIWDKRRQKVSRMLWERAQDEKGKGQAQTGPARSLLVHTTASTPIIWTGLA